MKNQLLKSFILLLFLFLSVWCQAQPNFALVGFATQNGGTTGGQGGQTVTVKNYTDLKAYAESATTYVIMVDGTISNGTTGGQIRIKSNKSIIGMGSTAFLNGVGLDISSQNNIIIQNLKMTLVGTTSPKDLNGGDCIGVSGTSKNIWIDHCELYSENPDVQTDLDKYDGLLDIKGLCGFITISWCYFHDHWKCGLVGAADDDLYDDRLVTLHHNYYKNIKYRMPMYRGATGHFFNNYLTDIDKASEIRAGTCVRVEKNYYENFAEFAIYTTSDSPGNTERIDNYLSKTQSRAYPPNCTASIPYTYSNVLTNITLDVKTIVPQYAGVGKLGTCTPPSAPTISASTISYCQNATPSALIATGTALKWYTVASGGTASTTAPTLSTTTVGTTTYYVSQTVNSCESDRAAIAVTVNTNPTATITASGVTTFCQGAGVTLSANTGTGFTYIWKNGTNQVGVKSTLSVYYTSGDYAVEVTNSNGCKTTSSPMTVTVNSLPAVPLITGDSVMCNGKSVTLISNATSGNQWSNGTAAINGVTNTNLIVSAVGTYSTTVTNANGCKSSSAAKNVSNNPTCTVTLIENSNVELESLTISPNPFTHSGVKITGIGDFSYKIVDVDGKTIEQGKGTDGQTVATTIQTGTYIITVETAKGRSIHKIVRQ